MGKMKMGKAAAVPGPVRIVVEPILADKGFADFAWIDPAEIVTAQWVRVKCEFGCMDYGLGACPPNTPTVDECGRFFREYKTAVIVRLTVNADKNSYPSGWSAGVSEKLLSVEREVFLAGFPKVFLLNQACCDKCGDCPGTRKDCRDKAASRPSPESFAVDVYQTARNSGLEIAVISQNPSEIHRITILLIE
jgi:predicted metal-binding protein